MKRTNKQIRVDPILVEPYDVDPNIVSLFINKINNYPCIDGYNYRISGVNYKKISAMAKKKLINENTFANLNQNDVTSAFKDYLRNSNTTFIDIDKREDLKEAIKEARETSDYKQIKEIIDTFENKNLVYSVLMHLNNVFSKDNAKLYCTFNNLAIVFVQTFFKYPNTTDDNYKSILDNAENVDILEFLIEHIKDIRAESKEERQKRLESKTKKLQNMGKKELFEKKLEEEKSKKDSLKKVKANLKQNLSITNIKKLGPKMLEQMKKDVEQLKTEFKNSKKSLENLLEKVVGNLVETLPTNLKTNLSSPMGMMLGGNDKKKRAREDEGDDFSERMPLEYERTETKRNKLVDDIKNAIDDTKDEIYDTEKLEEIIKEEIDWTNKTGDWEEEDWEKKAIRGGYKNKYKHRYCKYCGRCKYCGKKW